MGTIQYRASPGCSRYTSRAPRNGNERPRKNAARPRRGSASAREISGTAPQLFAGMRLIARSASAVMVSDGFTPGLAETADPSIT